MKTTGGERLLKADLADAGRLPAQCKPEGAPAKAVQLEADWFPKDARGRATLRCGTYYAYTEGHTLYAWQDKDDLVAGERVNAELG